MTPTTTIIPDVISYINRGWSPIPVPHKAKGPVLPSWQKCKIDLDNLDQYFNGNPQNVGILLGELSKHLTDTDLDCREAIDLAHYFLPHTGLRFGRKSSPKSHWLYTVQNQKTQKFKLSDGKVLVEIRSTGCQTIFPGSTHTSGEKVEWEPIDNSLAIAVDIDSEKYVTAVGRLAGACLIARMWPEEGARNDFALALAGALIQGGLDLDDTKRFIEVVAQEANDQEWESRVRTAESTQRRFDQGEEIVGLGSLSGFLGRKDAKLFKEWLGLRNVLVGTNDNPIEEIDGRLIKHSPIKSDPDRVLPLSTFSITPIEAIEVSGEKEHLRVRLSSLNGVVKEIVLSSETWSSNPKFLNCLPSKEFGWVGNSTSDLQWLRHYLSSFEVKTLKGVRTAGFHDGVFVTEEGAIGRNGLEEGIIYLNETSSGCGLLKQGPLTELDKVRENVDKFNISKVTMPILGWIVACFFKPRLLEKLGHFPLLSLEGEAGSGKTSTVDKIVMRIWALKGEPKAISEQTRFTLMKLVSGSNSIPLIFEENKSSRMNVKQQNLVSTLIRETYNSFEGQRGRADQSIQKYRYEAPVCIVGESGFTEPAIMDRIIMVHMAKETSAPHRKEFENLASLPLEELGRTILDYALQLPDEKLFSLLEEELEAVDPKLKDRPRDNAAVARVGLRVLEEILDTKFDKSAVDQALVESTLSEGGINRKTAVDQIIEALALMSENELDNSEGLTSKTHYEVKDEYIRIYMAGCYPIFKKWARVYDYDGDVLDESTFKKQLKNAPYFVENKAAAIGIKTKNCYILDIEKMKEYGLDLTEEWVKKDGRPIY